MAVGYTRVDPDKLVAFSTKVLEKMGVPSEDAAITSRLLVDTDLRGIESHGIAHLALYIKRMKDGLINPKPGIKTWSSSASTAVMDGDNGLGFVVGHRAMQEAILRARTVGSGFVSVRNSTHYGACSAYSLLAAKEDMVGISCTTGGRGAVAPGGAGKEIGINAMSVAITSGRDFPFCLDMATTIVAHGKIEIAQRLKKNVPAGWQIDPEGIPITDPLDEREPQGALVLLGQTPDMGVYKGFGLNVMVDILACMLSGSPSICELAAMPNSRGKAAQFFGAIRISGFLPIEEFSRNMEHLYQVYHNLPRAKGVEKITLAGELEWAIEQDRRKNGIPLDDEVIASLNGLSKEFNVAYDL